MALSKCCIIIIIIIIIVLTTLWLQANGAYHRLPEFYCFSDCLLLLFAQQY